MNENVAPPSPTIKNARVRPLGVALLAVCILSIQGCKPAESQTVTPNPNPQPTKEAVAEKRAEPSTYRSEPFPVTLDLETEELAGKLLVRGKTNLPDGTEISLFWESENSRDQIGGQPHSPVNGGVFESRHLSNRDAPLPAGNYKIGFRMFPRHQSLELQNLFGKDGSNLRGPLVTVGKSKYVTLERRVTISGPESVAERQSRRETMNSCWSDLNELWNELEQFKNADDFQRFAFAPAGRSEWMRRVEALKKRRDSLCSKSGFKFPLPSVELSLMQLGWQYHLSQGQENEQTRRCTVEIRELVLKEAE